MRDFLRVLILAFLLVGFKVSVAQYKVQFLVNQIPVKDSSETIFIAGNFNNWAPGDSSFRLQPQKGKKFFELTLPGANYEYKFTRGSWDKGETDAKGQPVSNHILHLSSDTIIEINIAGWNDQFNPPTSKIIMHTASENVRVMDTAFFIPQLNRTRRVWLYLPPDYKISKKAYPVLYMHDGQNLFDDATSYSGEWGVDEYLDSIISKGKKGVIVVGVDNGLTKRMSEYNPWEFQNFSAEGDQYVDFLVKTLKPFIDKNYRTIKNKSNTFIAGSSMGGLISLFATLKYPNVYGGGGIFSPAFWTASGIDSLVHKRANKMNSKLFFYAGGKEGESMVTNMLRIENIIKEKSSSVIKEIIDAEAHHHEAAWRKYFPNFYKSVIAK